MMYGRGYNGFSSCFGCGSGFMHNWSGMILMFLFIIITAIAVIFLIKRTNRSKSGNDALEMLKIRLAKGEISEDEYFRRKNLIDF